MAQGFITWCSWKIYPATDFGRTSDRSLCKRWMSNIRCKIVALPIQLQLSSSKQS